MTPPRGYKGVALFHKYWGKKPVEPLAYLVEQLTSPGEVVVDPFLGSGLIAMECAAQGRRFIGIDINPASIELASLLTDLPRSTDLAKVVEDGLRSVKPAIDESYQLEDGRTATHYLWQGEELDQSWTLRGRKRDVAPATAFDVEMFGKYADYEPARIRDVKLFHNSRINTRDDLGITDLFTGRALRSIELLLDLSDQYPERVRRAIRMGITAGSGQMSQMVFAITGRKTADGRRSEKIEVGSWVIGYWRPERHFEINPWNCFYNKFRKLVKSADDAQFEGLRRTSSAEAVLSGKSDVAIVGGDAIAHLEAFTPKSVSLIITDPPHGDRIPYLELSEMWNSILGHESAFAEEIVVSNARGRAKDVSEYSQSMSRLMDVSGEALAPDGLLIMMFNARGADSWEYLASPKALEYLGAFPMNYSAGSVVQDNRAGSLKHDFSLVYSRPGADISKKMECLASIPGWTTDFPREDVG